MPEELSAHLKALRHAAGLSLEDVCQATKIQARFVRALEEGRWSELPSNTHLRAFSVALAKACGADGAATADAVQAVLGASAPAKAPHSFDTPAPRPVPAVSAGEAPRQGSPALGGGLPRLAADGPALAPVAPASSLAAASARLRSLPLAGLLALLAAAGALSFSAAWGMDQWRLHRAQALLNPAAPPPIPGAPAGAAAAAAGPATAPAAAATAAAEAAQALPATGLTLRARRPCWLVLEVDGQRLPTVTMKDGDKLNWSVRQRAVLLAGNVGALRVWWHGDNLGYLGELDHRANAIIFEPGHEPRFDKSAALKLPPGVME
jgi:hypothetical protein